MEEEIQQLRQENIMLHEINDQHKELNGELRKKISELQNNRDKAIEYIENTNNYLEIIGDTMGYITFLIDKDHREELLDILKGDSDEF